MAHYVLRWRAHDLLGCERANIGESHWREQAHEQEDLVHHLTLLDHAVCDRNAALCKLSDHASCEAWVGRSGCCDGCVQGSTM